MPTNCRRVGSMASWIHPSWNVPSNVDLWLSTCLRKTLAALARMMASEFLQACDRAGPTSLRKAIVTSRPFLKASISDNSARICSLSMVELTSGAPSPSFPSRRLNRLTNTASRKSVGSSLLLVSWQAALKMPADILLLSVISRACIRPQWMSGRPSLSCTGQSNMWGDTSALVPQHPDHWVFLKTFRRSKAWHNRSLFHSAALSWLVLSRMLEILSRTKNTTTPDLQDWFSVSWNVAYLDGYWCWVFFFLRVLACCCWTLVDNSVDTLHCFFSVCLLFRHHHLTVMDQARWALHWWFGIVEDVAIIK